MKVRFLVNENFPAPSISLLREAGYDVVSVAESFPGVDDIDVLARSAGEQRWLATFDRDYGELLFARGLPPPPALILLHTPSYRPTDPAAWLMQLAQEPQARLGMFTVFDGGSIRSRPFLHPIGGATSS